MDPSDMRIEWWRRRLFWILDHHLIYSKKTRETIIRKPTEEFQKDLEDFIEGLLTHGEQVLRWRKDDE